MARRERKRKQTLREEAAQAAFFARAIVERGAKRATGTTTIDGEVWCQFEQDVTYADGGHGVIYFGSPLVHKADASSESVS